MLANLEKKYAWLPYVVPMVLFMLITQFEGEFKDFYWAVYIGKIVVVTIALLMFKTPLKEITYDKKWLIPSVIWGLIMLFLWIVIEEHANYGHVGDRIEFNPFEKIPGGMAYLWVAVRMFGLAIVVPVMEEIFWRSFAMRYATDKDFKQFPVGYFSWGAMAMVTGVFTMAHPEWLPALVFGTFIGFYINWTKSLFSAIMVHLTTNLGLGVYILVMKAYKYW
ncbi:MAG: CAAX prenyl protease-related protein [Armatimonadetes bacterium]|nr:CAAX prenyl protease-related protein [Armatimonadota bacterium]